MDGQWALSGELAHPGRGALGSSLSLDGGRLSVTLGRAWERIGNTTTYTGVVVLYE